MDNDEAIKNALNIGMVENIEDLDIPLGKLDDNGVDLSGGQWQRIAIAMACLSDSSFIILDEPTASLDPIAENQMYLSFEKVLKSRGGITISHRLASAKMADRIIVIANGKVSETGTHDMLMKKGGLYAKMYKKQSSFYASDKQGIALC